jgi:hypothetical protein
VERLRPAASLRETVAPGAVRVADLMAVAVGAAVAAAVAAEVAAVVADRVGIHPIEPSRDVAVMGPQQR